MSGPTNSRRRAALVARALDPGGIINAFVLEVAVQAHDPHWREREGYTPPLPRAAAEALEFVAELEF